MSPSGFNLARMSEDFKRVVDSDGRSYRLSDSKVVHIYPYATNDFMIPLFAAIYQKHGLAFRAGQRITPEILQQARRLCSGRECLSFSTLTGMMAKDISENRSPDELSIYYGLEQEGPCQIAGWPLVWETFCRRLKLHNAVFPGHCNLRNNYMGRGMIFGTELLAAIVTADLMDEAQYVLRVLAKNKTTALQDFKAEAQRVVDGASKGIVAFELALKKWARNVAKIPLKKGIEAVPKVLIFGGGILSLIHHPLADYFCEQGIVPKIVDFSEFILYLESENMMRFGFKQGRHTPSSQMKMIPLLLSTLNPKTHFKEVYNALRSKLVVDGGSFMIKRYKAIAAKSGLVYDRYIPFRKIIQAGNQFIPYNTYCEAIVAVGRFLCTVNSGIFNGFLQVATFNCQPSLDAQVVIRAQANHHNVPFLGFDMETPQITVHQQTLLEILSIQAWRTLRTNS